MQNTTKKEMGEMKAGVLVPRDCHVLDLATASTARRPGGSRRARGHRRLGSSYSLTLSNSAFERAVQFALNLGTCLGKTGLDLACNLRH